MKVLKIEAKGLKLFKNEISIDFYAKQRVSLDKNEMLTNLFSNVYINNVISFIGKNASGKTTTLKVISFALQLLRNEPINKIKYREILTGLKEDEEVEFNIYFLTNTNKISKLKTIIKANIDFENNNLDNNLKNQYFISHEELKEKSISSIRSKKDLFDFSEKEPIFVRDNNELFLLDDVSVMVAYNKECNNTLYMIDSIEWTDINGLRIKGNFPISIVQFLDSNIESLEVIDNENKLEIHLKFYGKDAIVCYNPLDLNKYLSSGTIKGINLFLTAIMMLKRGGYLIVDELENHFNKEIVSTFIRLFMDAETNPNGAVLIFSTHYIEIIDNFERNDNTYVIRNKEYIDIKNLSDVLNRNDVKKSDFFQSGVLIDTAPSYNEYIIFKRELKNDLNNKGN